VLFDYRALSLGDRRRLHLLNDSKQHTPQAREELFARIKRAAKRVAVVSRSVRTIDTLGLHNCNLAALCEALERVTMQLGSDDQADCLCLVDGFAVPGLARRQRAIIDGDARSAAVAAASIVAKVTRDRFMRHLHPLYPDWSFAENVGYSTPEHRAAIARHGVCPLHRMSFRSLAYGGLALQSPAAPVHRLPRARDVLEGPRLPAIVHEHPDQVEANLAGARSPGGVIAQPRRREPADALALPGRGPSEA
jgi:ribonuclease HII